MAEAIPSTPRVTITDDEFGGFRVTIPKTGSEGGRCVFGCALAGWAVVLVPGILYVVANPGPDTHAGIGFLVAWSLAGLVLALGLWASTPSCEIVAIDGKTLVLRREWAGRASTRTFVLARVRNLRPHRRGDSPGSLPQGTSAVAFDYDGKTHHFGVFLPEAEVLRLVKTLRQKFTIRDDLDDVEPLPINT